MSEKLELYANIVNEIVQDCYKTATVNGFHEDYFQVVRILGEHVEKQNGSDFDMLQWFDSTTEQAEIGRMHSELSEWLEGIRHDNPPDQHLPHLSSAEVEAADCIIRIFDTCGKRGYNIGKALVDKMEYNRKRPYKHGKNS